MLDPKCIICKSPDMRRAIELMWNGKMGVEAIHRVLSHVPKLGPSTITHHLKEHSEGDPNGRAIVIEPELPVRERVLALQRMQLDEFERRIQVAKDRADMLNLAHINDGPDEWRPVDWSEFVDILGKDMQAAIGSILKAQGLTDKREMKRDDLKLGLFEAMTRAGLAPKGISGGSAVPALPSGEDDDDDADD